jgi:hypothetical protein
VSRDKGFCVTRFPKYAIAQTGGDHPVTLIPTLLDHRRRIAPLRPSAKRPRGGGSILFLVGWKNLVPEPTKSQFLEALKFSRFRFTLIEFLKLPFDIGERALREVLERSCCGVYSNYLARAERVEEIVRSEDMLESEDTLEMNVHVSPVMDHRGSDSASR